MAKLRMRFVKEAQASYISHLDLMRTFQRDFLRAGLVVRHSQGFHPHPLMSILLPLPVGQSSECERMDFEVTAEALDESVLADMNDGLPLGLRILECYPAERPQRELQFLRARVEFEYDRGVPAGAAEALCGLFARETLVLQKRTKHRELADVDIRPMLSSLSIAEEPGLLRLDAVVQAQNPGLNPGLLRVAAEKELPAFAPDFVRVRRLALYDEEMREFR